MTAAEMVTRYGITMQYDMLWITNTDILRDDNAIAEILQKKDEIAAYIEEKER